jgi:hypothetical protein
MLTYAGIGDYEMMLDKHDTLPRYSIYLLYLLY